MGVHIHRLAAITPAGGDGDSGANALALKLLGAGGGLGYTADSAIGNYTFYGRAVAMTYILGDKVGLGVGQCDSFFFEAFAHTTLTAVNRGANTYLRMLAHTR